MRLLSCLLAAACFAQAPDGKTLEQVRTGISLMRGLISRSSAPPDLRADAEIYAKAAEWIVRHPEEFYKPEYAAQLNSVIATGMKRATELGQGTASWPRQAGRLSRAYVSRVDGSVQPYGVIIPETYNVSKPARLDVVLHGRAAQMNEVSFLSAHDAAKPLPPEQTQIVLEVFGRTNNAYRWAGETDVFEAIESVRKRYNIDPNRIVLRGFSMGGAGAWHLGLHHPSEWAAVEAGAGFAETRTYAKLPPETPEYQLRMLHIYDSVDYAENAANVPVVGYGGEKDPQLRASQLIQKSIEGMPDLRALFLVGPATEHKWHAESLKQSNVFIDKALETGRVEPGKLHFVTYTTRYNRCYWLTIDALDRHYERAQFDGTRDEIRTQNISAFSLDREGSPTIDGQKPGRGQTFVKENGKWRAGRLKGLRKRHGLQGPIDDAFMDGFVVMGAPDLLKAEWAKWMRGDLTEVTGPVKGKNLVLFGDPQTNELIRRISDKLPVRWKGDEIVVGSQRFPAADHTLRMIYPNPLDPEHYVVLNSGPTFGAKEFQGTNALLFPHLPDYAVIRKSDGSVATAGFFDESWQLKKN